MFYFFGFYKNKSKNYDSYSSVIRILKKLESEKRTDLSSCYENELIYCFEKT